MPDDFSSALATLFAGVSATALADDIAAVVHLLAMATALGTVIACDLALARRAAEPVTREDIAYLASAHRLIFGALGVLWLSGIALIALRTGFEPARISDKLVVKLITVAYLTLTAVLMARAGLPLLARSVGRAPVALPLGRKLALALCAGLSSGGWVAALFLGGLSFLKTAQMGPLLAFTGAVQGAALAIAVLAALAVHFRHRLRRPAPQVWYSAE